MKTSVKIEGVEQVFQQLMHAADRVKDSARKTMVRGANKILSEAKLNAPRDSGALEESIRMERTYGYRGRLQIEIKVGGIYKGKNVDAYAVEIHENYEGMLHHGPGKNTLAKMQANPGRYIGSRFLARAVDAQKDKLKAAMIVAVRKEWHL